MTKLCYQPRITCRGYGRQQPTKACSRLVLVLCAALSGSNLAHGQAPCPEPWATASVVYATIRLQAVESSFSYGCTYNINQTLTAQVGFSHASMGNCVWIASGFPTNVVSFNDSVTCPCFDNGEVVGSREYFWIANGPGDMTFELAIDPSTNSYWVSLSNVTVNGTHWDATSPDPCNPPPVSGVMGAGPGPGGFTSQNQPLTGSVLTGSSTFSAFPEDMDQGIPVDWNVTWSVSLVPDDTVDEDCVASGSDIGCQNQSLGEDIPITGTPFSLHYQSDRQAGRAGADSLVTSDVRSLGGWTLSVHHVLEPQLNLFCIDGSCYPASRQPKALYLGDGRMRSIAKIQSPVRLNGKIYLTSEDGSEVYVFDATSFRHLQTLRPLAGDVLYNFGYDTTGKLISVTDAYNNVTQITYPASGYPHGTIISPYGQTTNFDVDINGYLSRVTDPAGNAIVLVYSSTGLLTSMTDANGNTSNYQYDNLGRLFKDSDPVGGFTTLSRVDIANGYQVTKTTALGVTSTYQTTFSSKAATSSGQEFTNTEPCGAKTTRSESEAINQLSESGSFPDGTSYTTTFGADPQWGIQVAVPTSATLVFGSLTAKASQKRIASLGTAGNPFSLTDLTDTDTVNGRVYTSAFTASDRAYTNTTPAGRQLRETFDANGRLTSTQLGDLLPTNLAYDDRGRLTSVTQGTRSEVFTYDTNGYLASVKDPLGVPTTFTNDAVGRRLTTAMLGGRINVMPTTPTATSSA
jgi:YD repeat-containing protein